MELPEARFCAATTAPDPFAAVSTLTTVAASGLTVMEGLVLSVIALCVTFDAVTVWLGAVLSVTTKLWLPAARAALAGSTALVSLEKIRIVSFVLTWFQFASTALTVIENAEPAF